MKNIFKYLLNVILPPRCPYCGKIVTLEHTLCETCFNKIRFISAPHCRVCGTPFENETDARLNVVCAKCATHKHATRYQRSAIVYDDFSKKIILDFKFHGKTQYAPILLKWLLLAGQDILKDIDLIVPVPLSYRRLFKRGYNQSAILAKMLSRQTGISIDLTGLKKCRHTKPQSLLLGNARLSNVKNAFQVVQNEHIKGKRILLIDDVMTTGATLSECTKVLLKAGALSVDTLTVARVLKE